jgi:hypothetical protein
MPLKYSSPIGIECSLWAFHMYIFLMVLIVICYALKIFIAYWYRMLVMGISYYEFMLQK